MYTDRNISRSSKCIHAIAMICIVAVVSMVPVVTYADVTGEGDVIPTGPTDLPIGGGAVSGDIIVGDTAPGRLVIDSPAFTDPLTSTNGMIGNASTGIGQVTVSGFDLDQSSWEIDLLLSIGVQGQGVLNVTSGGRVFAGDTTTMPGVFTAGDIIVGDSPLSQGIVNVNGFASSLETHALTIGNKGYATVDVFGQGTVRSISATIGAMNGSSGTARFTGLGTRWINEGDVEIGTIRGNADDENGRGVLGINAEARVSIGVPDTTLPSNTAFGSGETNINELGRVELGGGTLLTYDLTNNGLMRGYGTIQATESFVIDAKGELRNAAASANLRERLYVADFADASTSIINNGTIESLGGEMEFEAPVDNNMEIIARDAVMRFNSGLTNTGTISIGGDTTLHGNINNAGDIFVLSDSESLIVGDLTFSGSGILALSIGEDAGTLDVTGTADLTGAILSLDYSAGITPVVGDSYQIFQANGGILGVAPGTMVAGGDVLWEISQPTTDSLFATFNGAITLPVGADLNGDGMVNALDMELWRNNYPIASGAAKNMGDADGDGDVDASDFIKIQRDFGILPVPPITAVTADVPEPSTFALALLTLVFCPRRRRQS